MPDISPVQLANLLQRAAAMRTDVKKPVIKVHPEGKDKLLMVDITYYTPGRRVQREAAIEKILDGRTMGQILEDWLGPAPTPPRGETAPKKRERALVMSHLPGLALCKLLNAPGAPSKPASKFDWNAPRPTELAPGRPKSAKKPARKVKKVTNRAAKKTKTK